MTSILTELKTSFLRKHSKSCPPEKLLDHFWYYYNKYWDGDCPQNSAGLGCSLWYLKRLLNEFRPKLSVTNMYGEKGIIDRKEVENSYVDFLVIVAIVEERCGDYYAASHFAKRALDMVDYFHPYANNLTRQKILSENENYKLAAEILDRHKEHWNVLMEEHSEEDLRFDWEKEILTPQLSNQNFQYRIHW